MGEYSLHSDIYDSLDYLIPPVKKSDGALGRDLLFSRDFQRQTDIRLIKGLCKKITKRIITPSQSHESNVQSSSSVILKKTTKELFHEQLSLVNLKNRHCNTDKYLAVEEVCRKNSLVEDKPMIKVTVIPKIGQTQTSKVFNKRCDRQKKLQNTVSNQESSISQNVYLMVKGKRREKVYEVKATESTKLSNQIFNAKYEDISIQRISNSKRLINSLNMEKKRKNKKHNLDNFKDNYDSICQNVKKYRDHVGVNSSKSKVTIVGQLGLTRDDQYVLKCAATINDKPIATNFVDIDSNSRSRMNNYNFNRNAKTFISTFKTTEQPRDDNNDNGNFRQQDSNIQTDFCTANKCMNLYSSYKERRRNSQGTQVNFDRYKSSKSWKNQMAQCNCIDIPHIQNPTHQNIVNNIERENNAIKDCKSPLVIISVYPRHGKDDNINSPVKIVQHPSFLKKNGDIEHNTKLRSRKEQRRNDFVNSVNKSTQRLRSRSPSPASKTTPTKAYVEKTVDKVMGKNNRINNISPQRQKNLNKSKSKLQYLKEDVSCYCPFFNGAPNQESSKRDEIFRSRDVKQTDTKKVKRALVNNFLRSVDKISQNAPKSNLLAPKNTSRVAININGEKERYDVLFEQRNFDTGLTVRKTLKNKSQPHSNEEEIDSISMENFLMLSDEIKEINNDKVMYTRETSELSKIEPTASRLNVRDSLEICRSREGREGLHINPDQLKAKYEAQSFCNSNFLAPVKHYRGDNCSIPDPNERDKEIRELLGIVRTRNSKKVAHQDSEDKGHESQKEKGCCCHRKCSKGLMTGLSLSRFFTSKCLKRKPKKQKVLNASTQSKKYIAKDEKVKIIEDKKHVKDEKVKIIEDKKHATESSQKSKKSIADELKENATQVSPTKHDTDSAPQMKKVSHAATKETVSKAPEQIHDSSDLPPEDASPVENHKEENDKPLTEKSTLDKEQRITQKEEEVEEEPVPANDVRRKEPVIEQNLILNRNIQVFLQVEQFTKQRPIILTRKQYDKVKKTIQCTISKNLTVEQRKRCNLQKCSVVSVGEVKVKPRLQQHFHYDREVQTERSEIQRIVKCIHIQTHNSYNTQRTKTRTSKKCEASEREINGFVFSFDSAHDTDNKKDVFEKHVKSNEMAARQTVSSMEIRYANVAYTKHITISSTHFGDGFHNNNNSHDSRKSSTSIHTIFKGHRKSATPNLGTSAYSLCSDMTVPKSSVHTFKAPLYAGDSKPKKPFLQRLISCLVMRSEETSILKDILPSRKPPSVNSSVDSYHISTSLGALEMTSSLYDTSASFYSNHTALPVNKMKRGFFSSVRGFLTARRS